MEHVENTCVVCAEPIEDGRTMCEEDRIEEIYESWTPVGCEYMNDR